MRTQTEKAFAAIVSLNRLEPGEHEDVIQSFLDYNLLVQLAHNALQDADYMRSAVEREYGPGWGLDSALSHAMLTEQHARSTLADVRDEATRRGELLILVANDAGRRVEAERLAEYESEAVR